jgi:hypothetical protein
VDATTPLTINGPSVIFDVQGNEAVIIDLTTGRYFRLDGPSTALWQQFVAPSSPAKVLDTCTTPEALRPVLDGIVADLIGRGLLRVANGTHEQANAAVNATPWQFNGFTLEEFTDLEDILGLDPIHEVDPDKGWPHAAPS